MNASPLPAWRSRRSNLVQGLETGEGLMRPDVEGAIPAFENNLCSMVKDCRNAARSEARAATGHEEAWLDSEDQIMRQEDDWLGRQAECLSGELLYNPMWKEAEDFNRDEELDRWMQVQEQIHASEEADYFYGLEEEMELELCEIVNAEDIESYLMMKALHQGANFLIDDELVENADYQTLAYTQLSAQKLVERIDHAMRLKMEEQRREALTKASLAALHQKELEDAAKAESAQFQSQIAQLEGEKSALLEMLEHEKDRTTCRICFTRPRDVLPLPCMHFDYCSHCLHQYQKIRNLCPTCRTPISGILTYNISIV